MDIWLNPGTVIIMSSIQDDKHLFSDIHTNIVIEAELSVKQERSKFPVGQMGHLEFYVSPISSSTLRGASASWRKKGQNSHLANIQATTQTRAKKTQKKTTKWLSLSGGKIYLKLTLFWTSRLKIYKETEVIFLTSIQELCYCNGESYSNETASLVMGQFEYGYENSFEKLAMNIILKCVSTPDINMQKWEKH